MKIERGFPAIFRPFSFSSLLRRKSLWKHWLHITVTSSVGYDILTNEVSIHFCGDKAL